MPLGSTLNSMLLLASHLDSSKPTVSKLKKMKNDKPVIFPRDEKVKFLQRVEPEEVGYSKEYVESYINEIRSDLNLRPNRLLLIKDNKVFGEHYEHPYVPDAWDCVFSSSKTAVSLALGVLYDQGKVDLDLPVCKILKNEKQITIAKNKEITLRHLLTMSTGITFNEIESVGTYDWVKSFFNSKSKFKFGTKFEYNSLNTYIISVCVEKLAGCKFEHFIRKYIFDRLDMNSTHLDKSDEGYFKGGWGLYILPEDMAKLGIMVRDRGVYNGERIISEEWVDMMSHAQFPATNFGQVYDYGFQMWADDKKNFCLFNGLYDQNILIFRNSGVVVVTAFGDSEAFHGASLFRITEKYFLHKYKPGSFELCKTHGHRDMANIDDLNYYYDLIANKEYKSVGKIHNTVGIIPLLLQNVLGTYTKGIHSVIFKKENDEYALVLKENGKNVEIKFNFKDGVRQVLKMYGNEFDCVCDGRFILTGKGEPLLIIRLYFLEFASSRYFSIKYRKDLDILSFEASENPGLDFVYTMLEFQDESTKTFLNNVLNLINPAILRGTIKNTFSPTFNIVHGEIKYLKLSHQKIPTDKLPKQLEQKKK